VCWCAQNACAKRRVPPLSLSSPLLRHCVKAKSYFHSCYKLKYQIFHAAIDLLSSKHFVNKNIELPSTRQRKNYHCKPTFVTEMASVFLGSYTMFIISIVFWGICTDVYVQGNWTRIAMDLYLAIVGGSLSCEWWK